MKLDVNKLATDYIGWLITACSMALVGAIIDVQFLKAQVKEDREIVSKTHQVTCLMAIQNKTLTDQEKANFCAGVR